MREWSLVRLQLEVPTGSSSVRPRTTLCQREDRGFESRLPVRWPWSRKEQTLRRLTAAFDSRLSNAFAEVVVLHMGSTPGPPFISSPEGGESAMSIVISNDKRFANR